MSPLQNKAMRAIFGTKVAKGGGAASALKECLDFVYYIDRDHDILKKCLLNSVLQICVNIEGGLGGQLSQGVVDIVFSAGPELDFIKGIMKTLHDQKVIVAPITMNKSMAMALYFVKEE